MSKTRPNDPSLLRNAISLLGVVAAGIILMAILALIANDLLVGGEEHPYQGIVTYMLLPGLLLTVLAFTAFGAFLEWRKRKVSGMPSSLVFDFSEPRVRLWLTVGILLSGGWLCLTIFGSIRAIEYTDSNPFCGAVCHMVMEPEYVAHKNSPHAKVHCVECHIGPGADWFVRAKLSGLHQVAAVLAGTYHTPIEVPVQNLRPAQDTCEQCHWPAQFHGDRVKVLSRFQEDEANTDLKTVMILKVGVSFSDEMDVWNAMQYAAEKNQKALRFRFENRANSSSLKSCKKTKLSLRPWRSTLTHLKKSNRLFTD